jgi:ubiquinone/menaquinone biosynthesis C-methylase UbiE
VPKSSTDLHWDQRALNERNDDKVNIHDTVQRDLELDFVFRHLPADGHVLEIGCGNGYVTQQLRNRARQVDAFDFAENMVNRARTTFGETNNRFFHGSLLEHNTCISEQYDAAICVRVLINLRNFDEQAAGLRNIANWLKPKGKLILVEGFSDGFVSLNRIRGYCEMPDLVPSAINYYSNLPKIREVIDQLFEVFDEFHTGMFDFLTRVVYPRIVGPDRIDDAGTFHRKIECLARHFNPLEMKDLARVRGFALEKKVR